MNDAEHRIDTEEAVAAAIDGAEEVRRSAGWSRRKDRDRPRRSL